MTSRHAATSCAAALICLALWPGPAGAQQAAMAPGYSRTRVGAPNGNAQAGGQNWGRYNGGYGNAYGYGFYPPYYFSPVIAGTWYARPYPYHFDYYRWRWGGNQPNNLPNNEAQAPANCPCANEADQAEAPSRPASTPSPPVPSP